MIIVKEISLPTKPAIEGEPFCFTCARHADECICSVWVVMADPKVTEAEGD